MHCIIISYSVIDDGGAESEDKEEDDVSMMDSEFHKWHKSPMTCIYVTSLESGILLVWNLL